MSLKLHRRTGQSVVIGLDILLTVVDVDIVLDEVSTLLNYADGRKVSDVWRMRQRVRIMEGVTAFVDNIDLATGRVTVSIDAPNHVCVDRLEVRERRIKSVSRIIACE